MVLLLLSWNGNRWTESLHFLETLFSLIKCWVPCFTEDHRVTERNPPPLQNIIYSILWLGQIHDWPPQWWRISVGQRKQQHWAIGPSGRHYTLVRGCSKDACPNCHQHMSTGPAKQISLSQFLKIIMCIIKILYQVPFMKCMLWDTTRSFLDQYGGHDTWSNSSQHLHQPIQHGWTSRWWNFWIQPSGRDHRHLKQTYLKLGKSRQNPLPSLHPAPKPFPRGARKLPSQLWKRLWQLSAPHPTLGWSTGKGC